MVSLILSVLLQALVLLLILSCDIPVVLDTIRWCRQQSCVLTLLLAPSYCYYCYYYHNLCVLLYYLYPHIYFVLRLYPKILPVVLRSQGFQVHYTSVLYAAFLCFVTFVEKFLLVCQFFLWNCFFDRSVLGSETEFHKR